MTTRMKTESDGSSDRLGHLALVDGTQATLAAGNDAAHSSHVLGKEGEVLSHSSMFVSTLSPQMKPEIVTAAAAAN